MSTLHTGESGHAVGAPSVLMPFFSFPLARTVSLRLVSLLVLLFSLWSQITCGGNAEHETCKTCGYNYKELPVRMRQRDGVCWVLEGKEEPGGFQILGLRGKRSLRC